MATTQQQDGTKAGSRALTTTQPTGMLGAAARGFSPFSIMRRMFEDMERMLQGGGGSPQIDVVQKDDRVIVRADLPGTARDDVRVFLDEDAIIIEAERHAEHEEQAGDVVRAERLYGRFERVIPLPVGAVPESAEARFEYGVLEIVVKAPKAARKGKQIEVKGS